jgi:UbiD family decarboxylase
MTYRNLQAFVNDLDKMGDLVRVTAPVDANLEIAEIHRRVIAANGPALLFTNVIGKAFPVATNLFGTRKRVELAFGRDPMGFVDAIAKLPETLLPPTAGNLWKQRHVLGKLAKIGFRKKAHAPVLRFKLNQPDLTALPALTSWKMDGGPFLTLPLVHTRGIAPASENLGMYRIQIFEPGESGMHFQIGKGGGYHLFEAEAQNQPLAANIYLGGPPALILSAIAPLPENVPELMLASLLLGEKLPRGKSDLPLAPIAEAEFCISGFVPPRIRRPEGPFGDHYGYYSLIHDYPVFRPTSIHHRARPIFPATVVGKPCQEDYFLGDYLQELLSPLFPIAMPGVRDLWSYGQTGYHALSAAVLKERYGRESMASVFRILGEGQLSLTKFLLATDVPIDLKDFRKVLPHILERADFTKDLFVFSDVSMDSLDYAGPEINKGSKGVLLGLGSPRRKLPEDFQKSIQSNLIRDAIPFCPGCLVVEIPAYASDAQCIKELAKIPQLKDWPLIVAVDHAKKATASSSAFLWTTFTRFDPAGDIYSAGSSLARNKPVYESPIVIDARMKPWYPDELFCDPETARRVTDRWSEYFPARRVEMGSSDIGHLEVEL